MPLEFEEYTNKKRLDSEEFMLVSGARDHITGAWSVRNGPHLLSVLFEAKSGMSHFLLGTWDEGERRVHVDAEGNMIIEGYTPVYENEGDLKKLVKKMETTDLSIFEEFREVTGLPLLLQPVFNRLFTDKSAEPDVLQAPKRGRIYVRPRGIRQRNLGSSTSNS